MKKPLSKLILVSFCSITLTGCFYGSCGDWNCSFHNPRWEKKVHDCYNRNYQIGVQELGFGSTPNVQDSNIGNHMSTQCIRKGGKYDFRKDKKYGYLFADACVDGACPRKEIGKCYDRNMDIALQKLGYSSYLAALNGRVERHVGLLNRAKSRISDQCLEHYGKYDIKQDKESYRLLVK